MNNAKYLFIFFYGWQSTLCMVLFCLGIQFHFLHHATHHARSMPLCSTVASLLCGGNDCRCAWKPLVGLRRCKQETNKHYVFQSDWRVCYTPWSASLQIPPAPPLPRPNHIIIFRDLFINICKWKKKGKKSSVTLASIIRSVGRSTVQFFFSRIWINCQSRLYEGEKKQ